MHNKATAMRFELVLGVMLAVFASSAAADAFLLVCGFSGDLGASSADEVQAIPYQVKVDYASQTVRLHGNAAPMRLSESEFSFELGEYSYSVSRATGEIRFFSAKGFADWKEVESTSIRGYVVRGVPLADARARVAQQRSSSKFSHRMHSGQCSKAKENVF